LNNDTLNYLRDESEIRDLIHRFVREADKRSVEGMVGCVSEEAVVSFNDGELVMESAEALRRFMTHQFSETGTLNPQTSGTHAMCNTIIALDGDRATAETSGVTYLATPAKMVHVRGVRYLDEFARIDGQWRIVRRLHSCDWQIDTPGYTAPKLLK
jgi:hypothetical protein